MFWLIPLACLGLLLYWELVIAEGVHLGPRAVIWLYDLAAPRYERIKKFDPAVEDEFLGRPLVEALIGVEAPRVLDVAAGTGRAARTLLRQTAFDGAVFNLELSRRMLECGRRETALWPGRSPWSRGAAQSLPFADATFDAVTCLEALEFLPDARAALCECVRVLRPGGLLVTTNRVGWDARLIPGKTFSRRAFRRLLAASPLQSVRVHAWQVDYDLAWARKAVVSEQ
jgi:ubiquinone/menaquinone biosynthesis C-methylase UbiE